MKKLISILAAIAIMGTMSMSISAATPDGTPPEIPYGSGGDPLKESSGFGTATGTDGTDWLVANDDDAITAATDPLSDITVWGYTSQIDTYKVTITWGETLFQYDFGTWNTTTHTWDGETWVAADFDGTRDKVTVQNHSSQPVDASFNFTADATNAPLITGTFTDVSGNLNGAQTGTMSLPLCPVGATDLTAPSDATYLNLQGIPNHIGAGTFAIGTITVTLVSPVV